MTFEFKLIKPLDNFFVSPIVMKYSGSQEVSDFSSMRRLGTKQQLERIIVN
jgi:hypothetical protein